MLSLGVVLLGQPLLAAPPKDPRKPTDYNEWNIPKDLYVTGDPFELSAANMADGKRLNFVACPILMDSDPTPLWFADYDGKRYFLRAQQNTTADVPSPEHGHRVLVEGVISDEDPVGGGIVLNPLKLSVMRELDTTCNVMLPARPGYAVAFAKRPPGPGTSGRSRETINTTYASAGLDSPDYVPKPVKRERREFVIPYNFDSHVNWRYREIKEAIEFARNLRASSIEIIGQESAVLLTNGEIIREQPGLGEIRARKVADLFADYTLKDVKVSSVVDSRKPDGRSDFLGRIVRIVVTP